MFKAGAINGDCVMFSDAFDAKFAEGIFFGLLLPFDSNKFSDL